MKAALFQASGSEQYDAGGSRRSLFDPVAFASGRYRDVGSSLYLEHGVSRQLTLFGDALFKVAALQSIDRRVGYDVGGVSSGMPDLLLGARLPVARRRIVAALEPSVAFPLRAVESSSSSAPRIGTPSTVLALAASVGAAIPARHAYAQGGAGYRARPGREPDEWFGDLEAGASLVGPLRVRVRVDAVKARGDGRGAVAPGTAVPETGGQDVRRIAPSLALAARGGSEIALTWRRAFAGRSALRSTEWELSYAFLGGARRR